MSAPFRPQLTHAGIYVRDLDRMKAFYCDVFSLLVTDEGAGVTIPAPLVFLSSDSSHHHQLVLAGGRPADGPSTINQLSFRVSSLDELRDAHDRAIDHGAKGMRCIDHGLSWSLYFFDPEDNMLEIYLNTPWYISQPHSRPFDIYASNDAILAATEQHCRDDPQFKSSSDWAAAMDQRMTHGSPN